MKKFPMFDVEVVCERYFYPRIDRETGKKRLLPAVRRQLYLTKRDYDAGVDPEVFKVTLRRAEFRIAGLTRPKPIKWPVHLPTFHEDPFTPRWQPMERLNVVQFLDWLALRVERPADVLQELLLSKPTKQEA